MFCRDRVVNYIGEKPIKSDRYESVTTWKGEAFFNDKCVERSLSVEENFCDVNGETGVDGRGEKWNEIGPVFSVDNGC